LQTEIRFGVFEWNHDLDDSVARASELDITKFEQELDRSFEFRLPAEKRVPVDLTL
jgi:hypothetical protein